MDLTFERYFSILQDFDKKFCTLDFEFEGTDFWPLIRTQVLYYLHLLNLDEGSKTFPKLDSIIEEEWRSTFTLQEKVNNYLKYNYYKWKSKRYIKQHRQLICFFDMESHQVTVPYSVEKKINPFINGVKCICNDAQLFAVISNKIVLNSAEHFVELFKQKEYEKIKKKILGKKKLSENIKAIEDFIHERVSSKINVYHFLLAEIIANQNYYQAYLIILSLINPKIIWTYNFVNSKMMALNRASHKLKIPTIEYQHSVQSDRHFAYLFWKGDKKKHAAFFPEIFWVWRESDKKRIEKNFVNIVNNVNVILGGNIYLAEVISKRKKKRKTNNKILITLQGFWIPEFIENYIKENEQYQWYIRLHPRYPYELEQLTNFANKYSHKVEFEKANTKPLYELFDEIDYHLTSFSGSALEAQAFGIQNIIYSKIGFDTYKEYIINEAFYFVDSSEELKNVFLEGDKFRKNNFDSILVDSAKINETLKQVMNGS